MAGNNASALTSVGGIMIIWATLIFAVRIWVKTRLRAVDFWGFDDTFVSLAFIISISQFATTCTAVTHGYGNRWSELTGPARDAVEKSLYASQILYICSIGCTRLSTCFFTTRLSRHRSHKILAHVWTTTTIVTIVASALIIAVRGDISQPWATLEGGEALYRRWLGVEVAGLLIDLCLCVTSSVLVWSLHMPLSKRFSVSTVFLARLLLTPVVALRLLYLSPARDTDHDEPRVMASLFTEACMQIGFILSTLTCLRSILRPFHSGFLITTVDTNTSGYKTGVRGRKGSEYLMLSAIKDSTGASNKPAMHASVEDRPSNINANPAPLPKVFIPDSFGTHQSAVVGHGTSNGSRDSQQLFISKTQTWTVEYEESTRGSRAATSTARCSSDEGHEHS